MQSCPFELSNMCTAPDGMQVIIHGAHRLLAGFSVPFRKAASLWCSWSTLSGPKQVSMLSHAGALRAARRLSNLCVHLTAEDRAPVRHISYQRRHEIHTGGVCASTASRETPSNQWRGASTQSDGTAPPKAALLLIGNEILSGSIQDTNTPWLARLLYR